MSDIHFRMTGDAQAVVQQLAHVQRAQESLEAKLRGMGTTSQKVGREERELNRMRAQVLQQIQTPQDQYNRKVSDLDRLLKANKLSQEQYNQAVRNAKTEMDQAGQSGERAFGMGAVQSLAAMAGGYLSIQKAIGLVTAALDAYHEKQEEASQRAREAILTAGSLRQVATDDDDFERLAGKTRRIQAMGIPEAEAAAMVFSGRSAQMPESEIMLLGQMRAGGMFREPAQMAAQARGLQQAMGVERTGGFEDIVSKALIASGGAPVKAEEILSAASGAASGIGDLPVRDAELMAFVARLSDVIGASEASTATQRLMEQIGRRSAEGAIDIAGAGGLMDMVERIEAMNLNAAELGTLLPDRARRGYMLALQGRDDIRRMTGDIEVAPQQDVLRNRLSITSPRLAAAQAAAEAGEIKKIAEDPMSVEWDKFKRARDLQSMQRRAEGVGEWRIAAGEWALDYRAWVHGPESVRGQMERGAAKAEMGAFERHQMPGAEHYERAAQRQLEAAEKMLEAAGALSRGTRGGETLAPTNPQSDR